MPAAPALDRPASRARGRNPSPTLAAVACIVFTAGVLLASDALLADPERVDVTIENSTDFDLTVRVRAPGENALILGPVGAGATKQITSVIDQGETWILEPSHGGVPAPTVEVTGQDVVSGPVEIPASVGEELRAGELTVPADR